MNTTSQKSLCAATALLMAMLAACKDEPTGPGSFTVSMTVSNLKRLEPGQGYYQLWISFPEEERALAKPNHGDGAYISFGTFNVSADGSKLECLCGSPKIFEPAHQVDINLATDAIVTIELEGEPDDKPGARLIGGDFTGNDQMATAQMTHAAEDVFDFDYAAAAAVFMLTTPTTAETNDFKNGIWWINSSGSTVAGIQNLLAFADSARWRYEGWVIDKSGVTPVPYSTGRFLSIEGRDHDLAGATAGADGIDNNGDGRGDGFAFPGQDFVRPANGVPAPLLLDNGNFETRITLEPEPDNSSSPSALTILATPVIGPNLNNPDQAVAMENRVLSTFPKATITINR
ncbi:MAG: hypothetical protein ACREOO_01280 [bacterium]